MRPSRPGIGKPWVIAHRGGSSVCPENTFAAFDEALRQRCDGIELDVQLTRDGVPVVYHDRTLFKVGGGRKRVARVDAGRIASLDAGSWYDPRFRGERIPSLRDVLRRYASRTRLLIELKARERDRADGTHLSLAEAVVRLARSTRFDRRLFFLSFDTEVLEVVHSAGLAAVQNVRAPRRMTASLRDRLEWLTALSVDVRTLSPSIVRAVHELGRPVMTYTCNTAGSVARAVGAGVDGVMSDRPDWLRVRLARYGAGS